MRLQFKVTSIGVPHEGGVVIVGFDMGDGIYGELPMSPEQAQQFGSDIIGASMAASRKIDGPLLVTPDLIAVSVFDANPTAHVDQTVHRFPGGRRHFGLGLDTLRYDTKASSTE